ncbi:MAG: indolepyruvate ferredoxin oxidoreductase subunit alpha [Acidimicrobiales bacterium]
MSLRVVAEACIGCGGCEYSCPTGALSKTDSFLGIFAIDPYTCDDCGKCVSKCPVDCIVADPAWPTCYARGCPLGSRRLAGTECSVWQSNCPRCGNALWRIPGSDRWQCSVCELGLRVRCPKVHHLAGVGS